MCIWIVLALFTQLALARASHDMPVMLWCANCSGSIVNPLHKTSKNEFKDLMGRFDKAVVIVKNDFCVEDVNKCHQESLQRLNSSGFYMYLIYLTSVESALSVLKSLPYNTTIVEEVNEGQLATRCINDLNSLLERYSTLKDSSHNLVIAITGKSCTYSSLERSKRATDFNNNNNIHVKRILFHVDDVYIMSTKFDVKNLTTHETNRTEEVDKKSYNLTLEYSNIHNKSSKITLKAHFIKSLGYFKFVGIEYTEENTQTLYLNSERIIEFPYKFSYHCGQSSIFTYKYKNSTEVVSIKLLNLQVQMDTKKFSTEVYDCVGFMSIPIWTGIFVTAILAFIMIWGLTMVMDIRTMDHFDDPKGKTITVTAQE